VRNTTVVSVLMLLVIFIYIINKAAWQLDRGSPD
jgi:hypothetical protein